MSRKLLGSVAVAAALFAQAGQVVAEIPKEINFGIISTESSSALRQRWQPVLDDLAKYAGLKVNAFFAPDYAGVIEGMRFKKVDLAWFGNKSAIEAVDRANGEVFMQIVSAEGAGYNSVLITHRDSNVKSLDDVLKKGKDINFGNGDPNSTSGFTVPSYYVFAQNKIDAKTHFKTMRSANHETNLMAVLNKQLDVATNNTEQMNSFKKRMPERYNEIRVLWTSPLIPSDPLVWRKDIDAELKTKLNDFFGNYARSGPEAERQKQTLLGIEKWIGFKASTNAQLIPIRQVELFRDKIKIESDTTMNAVERQAKLGEINRKLAELNQQLASAK